MINTSKLMARLGHQVDQLTNNQIIVGMLSFSLLLVFVGAIIWQIFGGLKIAKEVVPVTVVVTHPQVAHLVNEVGREYVDVLLVDPYVVSQTQVPSDAGAIFVIGKGYDDQILTLDLPSNTRVVSLGLGIVDDQDKSGNYWLSLPNAMIMSKTVADGLVQLQPEGKDKITDYHNQVAEYIAKEDIRLRQALAPYLGNPLVSYGIDLTHLTRDYGFTNRHISSSTSPGEAIEQIDLLNSQSSIDFILHEGQVVDEALQVWASQSGVSLVDLQTKINSPSSSFVELMTYNLTQISKAFN